MTEVFRTIGFPDHLFRVTEGSFRLRPRHPFSDTIFSTFVRATGRVSQLWNCNLQFAAMDREGDEDRGRGGWQEWESFIVRLSGQVVLFTLRAPARKLPVGAGGGFSESSPLYAITGTTITGTTIRQGSVTALVHEAAARDATAMLMNFGEEMADETVLKHGDLFGVGGNLYMTVANVVADEDGIARVPFRAPLWKGVSVGDIVNFDRPTCRVQLLSPEEGLLNLDVGQFGRAGLQASEVPYLS